MENEKISHTTEKKQPKKNVLGILSTVFAGVALIGCWMPLLNVISMIFAIAAIIMGIISFIFVLMKKSNYLVLPLIGVILSIISIAFSNGVNTAVLDSLSDKDTSQKVSSSSTTTTTDSTKDTDENKEYKVGDTISVNNQELTVTNVQRNYKPKYGSAKDGQEFVKVTLKLENKSDKSINIVSSVDTFKIQDSNGTIENDHIEGWSMDDYFNSSEIVPNGSKTGSLLFEVPKGDNNLTFIYEPKVLSDQRVKIKL